MSVMDKKEDFTAKENTEQTTPKPLRKLKRIQPQKTNFDMQNDDCFRMFENNQNNRYIGKHEAASAEPYVGKHEVSSSESYRGRHEAGSNQYFEEEIYDDEYEEDEEETVRKKGSWKDVLIKVLSVTASLVIIAVLILNMPILWYKKNGTKERVSVITYVKRWQPLVEIEGELDKTSVETKINVDTVPEDDGLDLPQLVEGQYTVLFIGFDEIAENTDVMWVCQFDIAGGKLKILQIPRDTAVPDFTSSASTKFNSIYSMGDQNINPPIQRIVNAVQQCFGIPIDAYITTRCFDIVDMVDLVGGIPITLDNPIAYEAGKVIEAGDVTLTGEQAEWFVRYRYGWLEGDIGRMQNQRRFMAAAMQKLFSIVKDEGKTKLYSYMKKVYDNKWIATDMSIEDLSKLADLAATLSMENVQVDMVPGEGTPNDNLYVGFDGQEYSIYSIHLDETLDLLNKYYRPYQEPLTRSDTAIVEWITEHTIDNYDNKTQTFDDLLHGNEPARVSGT